MHIVLGTVQVPEQVLKLCRMIRGWRSKSAGQLLNCIHDVHTQVTQPQQLTNKFAILLVLFRQRCLGKLSLAFLQGICAGSWSSFASFLAGLLKDTINIRSFHEHLNRSGGSPHLASEESGFLALG